MYIYGRLVFVSSQMFCFETTNLGSLGGFETRKVLSFPPFFTDLTPLSI